MLVTVIPLPSLMPSWGSHWAICWQQGFSCWFLILSCGWRGNPLDQPPEIEGAWKVKREGCEIEEKGIFFFSTRLWMPFSLLFASQELTFMLLVRHGMGQIAPSHPLQQGCVLAVTVPYFCLPWLLPTWNLVSKWNSWDSNQHFEEGWLSTVLGGPPAPVELGQGRAGEFHRGHAYLGGGMGKPQLTAPSHAWHGVTCTSLVVTSS